MPAPLLQQQHPAPSGCRHMHAAGRAALARASGAGLGRLLGSRGLQQAAAHCGAAAGASSEAPVLVVEYW